MKFIRYSKIRLSVDRICAWLPTSQDDGGSWAWTSIFLNNSFIELEFTYNKLHPFSEYSAMIFSIFRIEPGAAITII